jgi:hypothetical protein
MAKKQIGQLQAIVGVHKNTLPVKQSVFNVV